MFLTSYIFKSKAARALKGNWQTALIVSFIAGLPSTLLMLLTSTQLPAIPLVSDWEEVLAAYGQISLATIWLVFAVGLFSLVVTPVLSVSCNFYFIKRLQGEDLGVAGALSRRTIFWRALLLHLLMYARIFLWGLLFIVPGVLAALRYVMAPYFLAEDPELTPTQAINKSKEVMADKKTSYVMLWLSFIGWVLMAMIAQYMLLAFSVILALVASQFIVLFRITYLNASVTAFYLAASHAGGIADAKKEADLFMRELGVRPPRPSSGEETKDKPGDDEPGDDEPGNDGEDKE